MSWMFIIINYSVSLLFEIGYDSTAHSPTSTTPSTPPREIENELSGSSAGETTPPSIRVSSIVLIVMYVLTYIIIIIIIIILVIIIIPSTNYASTKNQDGGLPWKVGKGARRFFGSEIQKVCAPFRVNEELSTNLTPFRDRLCFLKIKNKNF